MGSVSRGGRGRSNARPRVASPTTQRTMVATTQRRMVSRIERISGGPAWALGHTEQVAHAADRRDGIPAGADFLPQVADVGVEDPVEWRGSTLKRRNHELAAGDDPPGRPDEV